VDTSVSGGESDDMDGSGTAGNPNDEGWLMGSLLLVPTEIMPDTIRMAHFVEVSSSNFLFG
jgi:hypothetical protein